MSPPCATCRNFHPLPIDEPLYESMARPDPTGECRAHPPTLLAAATPAALLTNSRWPVVLTQDWCGEWAGAR